MYIMYIKIGSLLYHPLRNQRLAQQTTVLFFFKKLQSAVCRHDCLWTRELAKMITVRLAFSILSAFPFLVLSFHLATTDILTLNFAVQNHHLMETREFVVWVLSNAKWTEVWMLILYPILSSVGRNQTFHYLQNTRRKHRCWMIKCWARWGV